MISNVGYWVFHTHQPHRRKEINLADAVYGTLYETGKNIDPIGFSEYNDFCFDLNIGMFYYVYFSKRHFLTAGFSIAHITQPDFGVQNSDELYRKYIANIMTEMEASAMGNFWMKPSLYFMKQGPSLEITPGIAGRVQFYNAINDVYLTIGVGFRMVAHNEAKLMTGDFIGMTQLHFSQFAFGFSYDVTISSAKVATSRNGGPEISLLMDLNFDQRRRHPRYFKMMKL